MNFKSRFFWFIKLSALYLILLPSLALSEEQYKDFFNKAQSLDKDKFFQDARVSS